MRIENKERNISVTSILMIENTKKKERRKKRQSCSSFVRSFIVAWHPNKHRLSREVASNKHNTPFLFFLSMAATVKQALTHDQLWEVLTDKPVESSTPEVVQRYRNYTSPNVSQPRVHPGRAYDPTHREKTHGDVGNIGNEKNGEIINPKPITNFENRLFNLNELVYERNRQRLKQEKLLPSTVDRYKTTFGMPTVSHIISQILVFKTKQGRR